MSYLITNSRTRLDRWASSFHAENTRSLLEASLDRTISRALRQALACFAQARNTPLRLSSMRIRIFS